jgi:hypothetical protein
MAAWQHGIGWLARIDRTYHLPCSGALPQAGQGSAGHHSLVRIYRCLTRVMRKGLVVGFIYYALPPLFLFSRSDSASTVGSSSLLLNLSFIPLLKRAFHHVEPQLLYCCRRSVHARFRCQCWWLSCQYDEEKPGALSAILHKFHSFQICWMLQRSQQPKSSSLHRSLHPKHDG